MQGDARPSQEVRANWETKHPQKSNSKRSNQDNTVSFKLRVRTTTWNSRQKTRNGFVYIQTRGQLSAAKLLILKRPLWTQILSDKLRQMLLILF